MRLSSLDAERDFVLLGPGFSPRGGFTLVRRLRPSDSPHVVLARYEDGARDARGWTGEASREEVEWDVAPRPLHPRLDEAGHGEAVAAIRQAIARGDVYQVNLTLRARLAAASGAQVLATLCRRGVPRFAAWARLPGGEEIVSASPELLFELEGRSIRCEPMKGTARDRATLEASSKDAAELAMITDLVRNDLVPICEPRSVRVRNARRFVELPYAAQTVSDVEGTLLPGRDARAALAALHPGGSITGAPKSAARGHIAALEAEPRGPYCGTLGLVDGERAVFSLLIRTASRRDGGEWIYGAGGGIVWQSDATRELEEVRLKLGALE